MGSDDININDLVSILKEHKKYLRDISRHIIKMHYILYYKSTDGGYPNDLYYRLQKLDEELDKEQ